MTLQELSSCEEVGPYSELLFHFLWRTVLPAVLSMSVSQIAFKILNNVFHDV